MRLPVKLLLKRLARLCFLLLIIVMVPVTLWFLTHNHDNFRFNGIVESDSENVGPVENSRILSIDVTPGQQITVGAVLARMMPLDRSLELAMNEARLKDYEQKILRYEQNKERYEQNLHDSARRAREALRDSERALANEKVNRARYAAELSGVQAEIARLQPLVDQRLIQETELSRLRPAAEALQKTVDQYAPLIETLEKQYTQANKDMEEAQKLLDNAQKHGTPNDHILATMREAAESCRLSATNGVTLLMASRSGVVARIMRNAGDMVAAGEAFIRVSSPTSLYINGMLTQQQLLGLSQGDRLKVLRKTDGAEHNLVAEVESIEPEVMDLLDPLNPAPRYPLRGRRVRLRLLNDVNDLIPGEAVLLEFGTRRNWRDYVKRLCAY